MSRKLRRLGLGSKEPGITDACPRHGDGEERHGWDILARLCAEPDKGDRTQSHILEHARSIMYHGRRASGVTLPFLGDTGEKGITFVESPLGTQSSSLRSTCLVF